MSQTKRVGSARQSSYLLETVESRLLLSAALPTVPAGWAAHPVIVGSQRFVPVAGAAPAAFTVGQASPDANAITPAQMAGAYGITGSGQGQTIAIVDAYDDPAAQADLNTFDSYYGLSAPPSFTKVNQRGQTITGTTNAPAPDPAGPTFQTGQDTWEAEESLDVQWAHVIAPSANIVLVEADSAGGDLFTAVATAARLSGVSVISMSWSGSEFSGENQFDSTYFTTPVGHPGVTFVAAAGDNGAYTIDASGNFAPDPQYPDTSPDVVSVGGTTLAVNGTTYGSERGWGSGQRGSLLNGGTGGGISLYETAPSYQTFVTGNVGAGKRVYPDVAMDADPASGVSIVDSYDTGSTATPWLMGPWGGTSLATPMFAAVVATADQGRAARGLDTLDGASQTLPRLYEMPAAAFHDITDGNNGYAAGAGYDLVTGRGSPVGGTMTADLASTYIGYHAFSDANQDGIQQAGEAGVSGVTVQLESTGGNVLQSTVTDASGFFQFLNPTPGASYVVHFVLPSGYQFSPTGTSTDPVLNSTANPGTGNVTVNVPTGSDVGGAGDYPYANCGLYTESISIADATLNRPQSGTAPMTFTVTISPASSVNTFTVPFTTVDGTSADDTGTTGPATTGNNDYVGNSGTLTFAPGVTTQTITVQVVGNTRIEKDLIFRVRLNPPTSEFGGVSDKTVGTGLIVNTSFPAVSTATSPADTVTRSSGTLQTIQFPVTLSAAAPFPVTVNYTTVDNTAFGTIDYTPESGTLTFPVDPTSGVTASLTQFVTVPILAGTSRQLDKTFFLQVSGVANSSVTGAPSQATGTILTNAPPAISVQAASVTESLTGIALLPFQVDVAPSLTGTVTVNYATADGTAKAGTDYQAVSGTLTFAPGLIQQTVYVPVYRQLLSSTTKTLTLDISNASSSVQVLTASASGTITYLSTTELPVAKGKRAVYTDNLGQKVTVSMTGPGSGQVVFLGSNPGATNAYTMSFTGTTAATNVTVTVAKGGQTTVGNLVIDGSLNVLSAKGVNVQSGAVSVTGTVNSLTLGYLAQSTITLGGAATSKAVAINLLRAVDTPITSAQPVRSLTAGSFISTTGTPVVITAPNANVAIHVRGTFGGKVVQSTTAAKVDGGVASAIVDSVKKTAVNG